MIHLKKLITEQVGSSWRSCKAWNQTGVSYWNGSEGRPKLDINVNDSSFYIHYKGRAGGHAIASAKGSAGDTMHQVFNVIVCECNKYLFKGKLKPNIKSIQTTCDVTKGIYDMTITIPFEPVESGIYQINRRGSMNNGDPGQNSILSQIEKVKHLAGPERIVVSAPGATIIEYFVSYDISR